VGGGGGGGGGCGGGGGVIWPCTYIRAVPMLEFCCDQLDSLIGNSTAFSPRINVTTN